MKALVTGGTGFIGSHLVQSLIQRGVAVRCLVRKSSDMSWLKGLPIECLAGDCRDEDSLSKAVQGVDHVYHLAGLTKAFAEASFFEVNARGTENLIRACLTVNPEIRKFIYLSSQAAAGPAAEGCRKNETDHCEPVSAYGRSKRMGEEAALAKARALPLVILRPAIVYGPRDKDLLEYIKLLSKRIKPALFRGQQRFSFCYVEDLIQAILLAAGREVRSGEIFFLTDGGDYGWKEIGAAFSGALGVRPRAIPIPKWALLGAAPLIERVSRLSRRPLLLSRGKVQEMIQRGWVCDTTKAQDLLGFAPQTRLPRGARLTVDWYRRQKWL